MSKIVSKPNINYSAKSDAFKYQMEAFLAVRDLDYSAIFHEQGLGKTKIAIDLLLYWLQKRDIDTVLIVTKKQLIKNWQEEFSFHTYLKPKVLSTNKKDNFYIFNSRAKAIITNFETISTEKERMKLFLKSRDVAIIIDESARLKNPEAKLTRDFIELGPLFKIRTIMTGTPVANRPFDIWAQIYFLDNGKSLGENFEEFKRHSDLSNKLSYHNQAREEFETFISEIFPKIESFSVRETKKSSGIQLPQKVYKSVFCDFEIKQEEIYNTVLNELSIEVRKKGKIIYDDDHVALKRLLRLNQIASNPRLIDDTYNCISGKERKLDELIKEIITRKEKCIVWSNFIENIDCFTKKYKKYGAKKIHGSMTIEERNKSVQAFKQDENCNLLFATPQAAKEGLTLTVANNVIFYDRSFNLDDYLQAQDRIHRISQKKTCYIYNIIMENSIDMWIDTLIEAKHHAALLSQGDLSLEEYTKSADYSFGDIIKEILNIGEEEYEQGKFNDR